MEGSEERSRWGRGEEAIKKWVSGLEVRDGGGRSEPWLGGGERGKKEPELINPNEAAWPLGLCR